MTTWYHHRPLAPRDIDSTDRISNASASLPYPSKVDFEDFLHPSPPSSKQINILAPSARDSSKESSRSRDDPEKEAVNTPHMIRQPQMPSEP